MPLNTRYADEICDDIERQYRDGIATEALFSMALFPAVTVFRNELGGTVVTFAGTPMTRYHYTEAFSFLCEARKEQLIDLLKETGNLPVYYPEDAEVYLRAAKMPDGSTFVAVFDLSLDPLEGVVHTLNPVILILH